MRRERYERHDRRGSIVSMDASSTHKQLNELGSNSMDVVPVQKTDLAVSQLC